MATPAFAAERIYISYGLLERSISINSIETYVRQGIIKEDLLAYARYATPEQLEELKSILLTRADVNPVTISQFLYTAQGEVLLRRIGAVIQTGSRQTGFYALRSALILAASDPDGLTPLNILRKFPVAGIRVDVERSLQIVRELDRLVNRTNAAIAAIESQSESEAAASPHGFIGLPDLRNPGEFTSHRETLTLTDEGRARSFQVDLYLPLTHRNRPLTVAVPVIVISHGLGSDRNTYAYLAEHLASYGFAVAVPEHPGSNSDQLQALIEGRASEVTQPREFIDRPLDITFLLNDLERRDRNDPHLRGRMNLHQVGVIGQSFGAYTALTLVGAKINFAELNHDCGVDSFNLSLLLQCRALDLPPTIPVLQDERVKAVVAINPIGSSILGETGFSAIDTPVMLVSGNADTVAPALLEQIEPFTWLNVSAKYLLLMRGATHFSTLGESSTGDSVVNLPVELVGPDRSLARHYLSSMSVAFFKTYLANEVSYRVYLDSAYARSISQDVLPLRLVQFLTPDQILDNR